MRFGFNNLNKFKKVDWKGLSGNKHLKINIGLAVVLIMFFAFFMDIMFSVSKFRNYVEEGPKISEKAIKERKAVLPKKAAVKAARAARVAIILDDAGGKTPDYDGIRSIKEPLTVSVIPDLPDSQSVAKALADAGFEVMLHLPMESVNGNYRKSGGGMVACSASGQEIRKTVLDDLQSVKFAVGVNNHMGSKATADERVMKDVFNTLKDRGLYFIDSRTSEKSIAFKLARSFRIRSGENNMFLDSETGQAYVEANFRRLIAAAKQRGSAIGIGHATRPATISALKILMPEYEREGVRFVYASELVR